MARLWVGTSGFTYKHWGKGVFYPQDLPSKHWFDFYALQFDVLEVNLTFYRLPRPSVFQSWYRRCGPRFRFVVKGSRYITHIKRMKQPAASLKVFFRALKPLKEKMIATLWQFPPRFKKNTPRLRAFLKALSRQTKLPSAFEFRDPSWFTPEIESLFREFGAAYCRPDAPPFYENLVIPDTAPFVYFRRHGPRAGNPYRHPYSSGEIRQDARQIRDLLKKRKEVFIFYNNDVGGHAPRDAQRLLKMLEKNKVVQVGEAI